MKKHNTIIFETGWNNARVEVEWHIDDEDLSFKVFYQGIEISDVLSDVQIRDIEDDLRVHLYERDWL